MINNNKYFYRHSIVGGELEHLYTFNNFPVFMSTVDNNEFNSDIFADMEFMIDKSSGLIQMNKLVHNHLVYQNQHCDNTGKLWNEYNDKFSKFVINNIIGYNILEIGGGRGNIANNILRLNDNLNYTMIEPNTNLNNNKIKLIKKYFPIKTNNKYDVIIFSQLLEHMHNPNQFLYNINNLLVDNGKLIFGYPDMEFAFKNKFTNVISFEHSMLLTDYYVDYLLKICGFKIVKKYNFKHFSYFYICEKTTKTNITLINKYKYYKKIFNNYIAYYTNLVKNINKLIINENNVYLFGAHTFSHYLINFGLDIYKVKYILDNSKFKKNKRLYGTKLIVKNPDILKNEKNSIVILHAGQYNNEIKKDILTNINSNVTFI